MKVEFSAHAEKNLEKLDGITRRRVLKKLQEYAGYENPLAFAKSITDSNGYYRFRVGDIRIIFSIYPGTLIIERIGRRDSIY